MMTQSQSNPTATTSHESQQPAPVSAEGSQSAPVSAPPVSPVPVAPPPVPSAWPAVIGGVAVGLGVLGILLHAFALVSKRLIESLMDLFAGFPGIEESTQLIDASYYLLWPTYVVGLGLAVLLLVFGMRLLNRNPRARTVGIIWAWGKIVLALVETVLGVYLQRANVQMLSDIPTTPGMPAFSGGWFEFTTYLGSCFNLILYAGPPVALLIWFARPRIIAEMSRWRRSAPLPAAPERR
ncbi:MAG: hypothetical protein KJ057_03090 [Phycisphaerae bacterium]|nr:MAG: hypothetical protein EDS66_14185 [Planctomycetota bacterium]KAB2945818.1 MAG: hypothetical protein F9K17_09410 [Phycisphaerae bacterium]MBE7457636.1 hypothetical protein [Planctomycetia bacterium]MCK6463847.1 hypothetical protein [Phycisphaerae bacterium]MCL4717438.1 hypothetical protein [Phycisphaerae bacterium]